MTSSADDARSAGDQPKALLAQLRERLAEEESRTAELYALIRDDLARLAQQLDRPAPVVPPRPMAVAQPLPVPVREVPPAEYVAGIFASDGDDDLELAVFGPEFAANESLADDRAELLDDVRAGHPAALLLSGAILSFRGATGERVPQLLKDIGEAWYGWRPETAEGADYLRDELCGWLQRKCAEAGVPNVIELVRPGDRYDSKRHHARQPGVEVVEVGGWVVLRDNGKVYTKAAVTVR